MRFVAVVLLALALAIPAEAAESDADVNKNRLGDGIQYGGSILGQPGAERSSGGGGGGARAASKPVYFGYEPTIGADAAGQPCVTSARRSFETPSEAANFGNAQEQAWVTLLRNYSLCPGAELPQADPAVLAEVFWGEVLLPKPVPHIEPGWAMTGRPAYLETRAPMTQTFTRDTPLGPLTITATGEFLVDWGDGVSTGPHRDAGGPWPDGRITHGYTKATTLDVVVTEQWRATWALAGRTGNLTALRTEGRIEDLPVREVQAVRNR